MTDWKKLSDDYATKIEAASPPNRDWIGRVRGADAEAETRWRKIENPGTNVRGTLLDRALIAIAAELRAQRISRRPGAGQ